MGKYSKLKMFQTEKQKWCVLDAPYELIGQQIVAENFYIVRPDLPALKINSFSFHQPGDGCFFIMENAQQLGLVDGHIGKKTMIGKAHFSSTNLAVPSAL